MQSLFDDMAKNTEHATLLLALPDLSHRMCNHGLHAEMDEGFCAKCILAADTRANRSSRVGADVLTAAGKVTITGSYHRTRH